MGFINSYKHLEKLCGEIFADNGRISAYIDEMYATPQGSRYVKSWNEDLRKLKHYRWLRNQIVHEPDCSEENMCTPEDELWIDDFYSRILNQTDPLALYQKAIQRYIRIESRPIPGRNPVNDDLHSDENHFSVKYLLIILLILFFVGLAVLLGFTVWAYF